MFKKLSPTKVSEVVDFDAILADLNAVEAYQIRKVSDINMSIEALEMKREDALVESGRAQNVAKNIRKLLGELA